MGKYVLKYRGAERMDELACGRELLASFMAMELEIHVPEPAIIQVNDYFLDTMKGSPEYAKISKSEGLNFGSRYMEGNLNFTRGRQFTLEQEQEAARIFIFDVMLKHSDRNVRKPNMFEVKEHIYVIDHELAFGFLFTLPFLLSQFPWQLNELDVNDAKNHFFYPLLKGNNRIDWESAFDGFEKLNAHFWTSAEQLLPQEWNDKVQVSQITQQIIQILEHFNEFKSELWTKLIMQ